MIDTDTLEAGVEPETPKMRTLIFSLEKTIHELVCSSETAPGDHTLALLSIAVSAKRIADCLDELYSSVDFIAQQHVNEKE